MKASIIIMALGILMSSCASTPGRSVVYEASTIERECKRIVGLSVDFSNVKKEDVKKWEQFSGYSQCEYTSITADTIKTVCKEPSSFKKITTTNMAKCHVFSKGLNNEKDMASHGEADKRKQDCKKSISR